MATRSDWHITAINNATHTATCTHKTEGHQIVVQIPPEHQTTSEHKLAFINGQTDAYYKEFHKITFKKLFNKLTFWIKKLLMRDQNAIN